MRKLSELFNAVFISIIFMALVQLSQFDKVEKVINNTIQIEGGFSNHQDDKGGATKFGITLGLYQKLVNKNATIRDIQALSANEARQFYKTYFFYKYNLQELPEPIWDIVFDMCVNHGPSNAFSITQLALVKIGQNPAITGQFDTATKDAISKVDVQALRTSLIAQRASFYAAIIRHKPSQKIFANGWFINRVAFFTDNQVLS
jgi:lysozyme family protein